LPDALVGGAISGIGSLAGGLFGSNAASSAAKAQTQAAQQATALQAQIFGTTQNNLGDFIAAGREAGNINSNFGRVPFSGYPNPLTPPPSFDPGNWLGPNAQQTLAATPGYQFTLQQGLRNVQNAAAAQGRGISGNALAGAAKYATGLADATYNQQYQNALQGSQLGFNQTLAGQQQAYNQGLTNLLTPYDYELKLMTLGANAAAGQGQIGASTGSTAGNFLTQGGNAQAAGIIGGTNALTSGFGGAANSIGNAFTLNQLLGGGSLFGGGQSALQSPAFSQRLNDLQDFG
jgi:hypothetical protein